MDFVHPNVTGMFILAKKQYSTLFSPLVVWIVGCALQKPKPTVDPYHVCTYIGLCVKFVKSVVSHSCCLPIINTGVLVICLCSQITLSNWAVQVPVKKIRSNQGSQPSLNRGLQHYPASAALGKTNWNKKSMSTSTVICNLCNNITI